MIVGYLWESMRGVGRGPGIFVEEQAALSFQGIHIIGSLTSYGDILRGSSRVERNDCVTNP